MRSSIPHLPWLRAFEATARHLSFTNAAQELGLTQAAVSKQVKLLEDHLGALLFVRRPRSLEITRIGQSYLPHVAEAFDGLAAGTNQLFPKGERDVLTVRTSIGFGALWLAQRLPDFRARHPNIGLRIISNVWNENGVEGHCDLDIRYGCGDWPDRDCTQLTRDVLFPVCHPQMIEAGHLKVPADLIHHTLIDVIGYAEGWSDWLKAASTSFQRKTTMLGVDTTNMAFAMLRPDFGVTLTRQSLAQDRLENGQLAQPFTCEVPAKENVYLTLPNTTPIHPDAAAFKGWIVGHAS